MRQIASVVLCFYFVATLSANDLVIKEKSFGCVLDLSKVRNTCDANGIVGQRKIHGLGREDRRRKRRCLPVRSDAFQSNGFP
jgi:hypothetical protein